jgi:hypothetical protein
MLTTLGAQDRGGRLLAPSQVGAVFLDSGRMHMLAESIPVCSEKLDFGFKVDKHSFQGYYFVLEGIPSQPIIYLFVSHTRWLLQLLPPDFILYKLEPFARCYRAIL